MGRFYKTSESTPIDYMYRINTPLMEDVLNANDNYVDQSLAQTQKLGALAQFNHTDEDSDGAQAITDQYTQKINDLTNAIYKDPANWRKQLQPLRDVTRDLQNNYTNGDISKYIDNYNDMKKNFDAIDQQVALYNKTGGKDKDGNDVGVDPLTAERAKAYARANFKGTKNPDGTYNSYTPIPLMDNIDLQSRLSKGLDKLKDDGYSITNDDITQGGQYFNKSTNTSEYVSPEKLLNILTNRFKSDPGLMDYIRQRSQIGAMQGALDSKGNLVSPYTFTPSKPTAEEAAQLQLFKDKIATIKDNNTRNTYQTLVNQLTNKINSRRDIQWDQGDATRPASPISSAMQAIIQQYSHNKTTQSNELSGNPVWSTMYTQKNENIRANNALAAKRQEFEDTQRELDKRLGLTLDNQLKIAQLKANKSGSSKSGSPNISDDNIPTITTTSKLGNNPLAGQTIRDVTNGSFVPVMSQAGISSMLINAKKAKIALDGELSDVNNKLNNFGDIRTDADKYNYQKLLVQKQDLERQSTLNDADLTQARNRYKAGENAVFNDDPAIGTKLDNADKAILKKYGTNFSTVEPELINKLNQAKKLYPATNSGSTSALGAGVGAINSTVTPSPQQKEAQQELDAYRNAKANFLQRKNTFYQNKSKDYITSDAIRPNSTDGDFVKNIMFNNPQGLQIFDENSINMSGNTISRDFQWKPHYEQPDYNMNFEGTDNNLLTYIRDHNVKVSIQQVAPTTGLGDNATSVAEVTFDDPNGKLPKNKPFYITLSPEKQAIISNYFSRSSDPDVANIGRTMGDPEANSLRSQLAQNKPIITVNGPNGSVLPIHVEHLGNGHLGVLYKDSTGAEKLFPKVRDNKGKPILGGHDGFFNGTDNLIKNIELLKAKYSQQ